MPIPPTQIAETVQKTLSEGSANIQSTLQRTLSDPQVQQFKSTLTANLHTLQENVQHLQENVATGVQHLQESLPDLQNPEARDRLLGDARKQGEDWLKQAGEFLQDAVKVVPPAPGQVGYQPGMIWDGSDVWMFSEAREEEAAAAADQKGKGKEGISVSRTGALLRKLRTDPEMIHAVPSGETYEWFCGEIDAKDGGLGSDEWNAKCEEVEKLDGLKALRESLVPSELDEVTFWRRYWFRAWQIQREEEKRKALLQGIVFSSILWPVLDLRMHQRRPKRRKRKSSAGKTKTRLIFSERQNHPRTTLTHLHLSLLSPLFRRKTSLALANRKTLTTWSARSQAMQAAVGYRLVCPLELYLPVALAVPPRSPRKKWPLRKRGRIAMTVIGSEETLFNNSRGVQ